MITSQRDTDKLVLQNMDDRTLMNTMKANKSLLKMGEDIFKERLRKAYPLLYTKKPFLESYRNYYLKMMYYLGKLKEEFNVDYIPAPSFDPEALYRGFSMNKKLYSNKSKIPILEHLIPFYTEIGDEGKLLEIGNTGKLLAVREALRLHIVENLIKYKQIDLFKKFAKLWDLDANDSFNYIIQSNDKNIIQYFLNKHDYLHDDENNNYEEGLLGAAEIGSMEMFEYVMELFPEMELDRQLLFIILAKAATNGQVDFLRNFLIPENEVFLMKFIPRIFRYFVDSREMKFLPESKVIQTLDLLLDYYLKHGGTKKDFYKEISYKEKDFFEDMKDPNVNKFIKEKFRQYE
jgi:hypothetical protein